MSIDSAPQQTSPPAATVNNINNESTTSNSNNEKQIQSIKSQNTQSKLPRRGMETENYVVSLVPLRNLTSQFRFQDQMQPLISLKKILRMWTGQNYS